MSLSLATIVGSTYYEWCISSQCLRRLGGERWLSRECWDLPVTLSNFDRTLLERCLSRAPKAWEDFVDRFLGLVVHVVHHSAKTRSITIDSAQQDDLVSEVFLALVRDDFAILRKFRQQSSLATYLTVIARRVVVRKLAQVRQRSSVTLDAASAVASGDGAERVDNAEEVEILLQGLPASEAEVVRLFHLDGLSYREIVQRTGVPENSIGPLLSRAREALRQRGLRSATGNA